MNSDCYVFVCLPRTAPELETIQVKLKDYSHCHFSITYFRFVLLKETPITKVITCIKNYM